MGGSDLCEWATVTNNWNAPPTSYARDLGRAVGCGYEYDQSNEQLVLCLRGKHYEEIVNATANIQKRYGSLAGPFGPVVDGAGGILPIGIRDLRKQNDFMKIKILAGVTQDAGAYVARNLTKDLPGVNMVDGLDPKIFRRLIEEMVRQRSYVRNPHEVAGATEFEYTFWAKPDNKSAVRQNLIDLWSDQLYGSCVDELLRSHAFSCPVGDETCPPAYMYLFAHRSEYEPLPFWMGVPHGRDVDYFLGYPFYNDTLGNITGVYAEQTDWTYLDRNISEFFQDAVLNFTKYGVPTPDWIRNISWFPYRRYNLSYLHVSEFGYMDLNYRQNHYAFWRDYYPRRREKLPITTTPQPTPYPRLEYQVATWSLVGACLVTLIFIAALAITLCRKSWGLMEY